MLELNLPEIHMPSADEIEARRQQRCVAPLHQARQQRPELDIFSALSLSEWSRVAQDAGVPSVPAEVVCILPIEVIFRYNQPQDGDMAFLQPFFDARAALKSNEMLRWDCCASMEMKNAMSEGEAPEYALRTDRLNPDVPVWRTLEDVEDMRLLDIIMEYPSESVAVIKRPWIEARREGTHSVEYRVFVANGKVEGVANYYLQRDLPLSEEVTREAQQAISLTGKLIEHMESAGVLPFNLYASDERSGLDVGKASFTADFLVDQDGQMLFLEAGPPFGLGAHPCAFVENRQNAGPRNSISVQGVCLGIGQAPLPLSQFEREPASAPRP